MSPSRPSIGVAIAVDNKSELTTHVLAVADVWRSRWIVVSAGTTSDCSIE
jgi:hypothetical protein